jgi:hypothetical protein
MATSHDECIQTSRGHILVRRKAYRIAALGEILSKTASETARASDVA